VTARLCLLVTVLPLACVAQQNAGYSVAGKVIDTRTGVPLSGAELQLSLVRNPQLSESAITSPDGAFRFDRVPEGKYMLAATRRRYVPQYYLQHENYNTGIAVGPGLDSTNIVFPLNASAVIFGRATDENGDPVPNAAIHLIRQGVLNGARMTYVASIVATDNDGRYRQAGLGPGTYFVGAVAQPWYARQFPSEAIATDSHSEDDAKLNVTYPVTFYPGTQSDEQAGAVTLAPGVQMQADFILRTVPAAQLLLTDSTAGEPQPGRHGLGRQLEGPGLFLETHWGLDLSLNGGFFSPRGMVFSAAPGRYSVRASWSDASGTHTIQRAVELQSAHDTLDIAKQPALPTITATATDASGAPSDRASSLALRNIASGQILPCHSLGRGRADWANSNIAQGRYEIVLTNSNGSYIRQITASGARISSRTVEFTGKSPVELRMLLAEGEASLSGKVERDGKAVAGTMVLLLPEDFSHAPSLIRRDQSDSDGTFAMTNIVPGRYTIVATPIDENLEYTNAQAMQLYLAGGKAIDAVPNGKGKVTVEMTGQTTSPAAQQ
jgi:hypothetical protein